MFPRLPPATKALLIITVATFGLQLLFKSGMYVFELWPLQGRFYDYSFRPWQLLTYGFLHGGFFHLFFNMLVLFMFGAPLEQVWGSKRFTWYYLLCIIGAGLCHLAVDYWLAKGATRAIGASGGVLGLVLGYAMIFPRQKVMVFPIPAMIPARVAAALFGIFALFAGVSGTMPGVAHFAHLGGMLTGWLLICYWRRPPASKGGGKSRPHLRSM